MVKKIGKYQNGNHTTILYEDGTRIRKTADDFFTFDFPESIDLNISDKCDNECEFCYANHSQDGNIADLSQKYLNSMHPYTEIAINLNSNFLTQDGLLDFLNQQYNNRIIVNATININDFIQHFLILTKLIQSKLINGIGISLGSEKLYGDDLNLIACIPNAVIHIVDRVVDLDNVRLLLDYSEHQNIKVLILGYKTKGRGETYSQKKSLIDLLPEMHDKFTVVSYDNLALDTLHPEQLISDEEFNLCYQGDDGTSSFYIDAVNNTYALSSNTKENKQIQYDQNIDDLFQDIKNQ